MDGISRKVLDVVLYLLIIVLFDCVIYFANLTIEAYCTQSFQIWHKKLLDTSQT